MISCFYFFIEINEKKGVLKQYRVNKKSRKWSSLNKNQQKSNVLSGIMIFRTCTTLFIFSISGVFWKTHLKMCFNRDIDVTKSHQKSSWVSVKNTQRPLKWNNHDLVCYSPKRNFPKTQLKMSPRRYIKGNSHHFQSKSHNKSCGGLSKN